MGIQTIICGTGVFAVHRVVQYSSPTLSSTRVCLSAAEYLTWGGRQADKRDRCSWVVKWDVSHCYVRLGEYAGWGVQIGG